MNSLKVVFFVLTIAFSAFAADRNVFFGEISDSQCGMNIHSLTHSHQEMIEKRTMGTDAASCARACIRRGGEWVLRAGNDVYRLKNQAGIEPYAGEKVRVTGPLDPKTNSIDNTHIEVFPRTRHSAPSENESIRIVR
jgi:hypothetical protein